MNPSDIIPDDQSLPVPVGDSARAAHQRAPTLMAGDASHGAVRVWSPDLDATRERVWWDGTAWVFESALVFCSCATIGGLAGVLWGLLAAGVASYITISYEVGAVRRPCYLASDECGIAVAAKRTSRTVLWTELRSLRIDGCLWVLTLNSSKKLTLNMCGYSQGALDSLLLLLTKKACLHQHPNNEFLYEQTP